MMKKWTNAFQNMRFRNKMMLYLFSISMIPLLVFSSVLGGQLVQDTQKTALAHGAQMVNQMTESIDVYIGTVDKLADYIIGAAEKEKLGDAQDDKEMRTLLGDIMRAYPEIAGIMMAFEDDSYVSAGMSRISRDRFVEEPWFQLAQSRDGQLGIISSAVGRNVVTNTAYSADKIFSVVKTFYVRSRQCSGVVLIDIQHDIIEQLIESISVGDEGFLYVTDSENNVVYTPVNPLVYRIDEAAYRDESDATPLTIDSHNYWISSRVSDYTGWRSVGVVTEHEYYQSMSRVSQILLLSMFVCIICVLVMAMAISSSVTKPILALRRLMSKVEAGDFSVRFHASYTDEIGELGMSFNHMLEQINTLIHQLYVEKQARLEAQLKTLQEQIKPHFLYNTLDTISWMARDHDAYDVVSMVEALTNMFRIGLSKGKDYISLKEETYHVRNYLYIQNIRYQEKLKYEIDIPEEFDAVIVPKLILQPLVENAIYHGIKLKPGGGTIRITCCDQEDDLLITIHDDGVGIEPERLALLQKQLRHPERENNGMGFGMFYVAERIALYYGDDYGVTIDSRQGEETTVTLRVPKVRKKEERNV